MASLHPLRMSWYHSQSIQMAAPHQWQYLHINMECRLSKCEWFVLCTQPLLFIVLWRLYRLQFISNDVEIGSFYQFDGQIAEYPVHEMVRCLWNSHFMVRRGQCGNVSVFWRDLLLHSRSFERRHDSTRLLYPGKLHRIWCSQSGAIQWLLLQKVRNVRECPSWWFHGCNRWFSDIIFVEYSQYTQSLCGHDICDTVYHFE